MRFSEYVDFVPSIDAPDLPVEEEENIPEFTYQELTFEEWCSEFDEEAIILYQSLIERARSYGLPLFDNLHVADFVHFCYENSSSKFQKIKTDEWLVPRE